MNIPALDSPAAAPRRGRHRGGDRGGSPRVFYSVVAGAVDRADTQRRAAIQLEAAARAAADARFAARPVLAVPAPPRMAQRDAPRTVAFRSTN